jgi:hypothetical protein
MCVASMALKASSSIFIKCHILPKHTLLTTWILDDLPRQRNLKKLGIKRTWSPGVNLFSRCKPNILRGKLKLKVVRCNKLRAVVGETQPRRKEVTWTKQPQLEMVLAGVDQRSTAGRNIDDVQTLGRDRRLAHTTDQDHQPTLIDLIPATTLPLQPKSLNEERCVQNTAYVRNVSPSTLDQTCGATASSSAVEADMLLSRASIATLCLDLVNC